MTKEEQNGKPKPLPTERPVIDPTQNVLQLVEASITRIDDLMAALFRRIDDILNVQLKRIDDKVDTEKIHVREIMTLRSEHSEDLRGAEAKRIDAIRVVDTNAVTVANERATAQATVLANQVSTSAETLRALVASTAVTAATQASQNNSALSDRISSLEKVGNIGAGKETLTDPLMAKMVAAIDTMQATLQRGSGKSAGFNAGWLYLLGGVSLISTLVTIFFALSK